MRVQDLVRFLRTVAGRREPVRAEPDPGQDGYEGKFVKQTVLGQVTRAADEDMLRRPEKEVAGHVSCLETPPRTARNDYVKPRQPRWRGLRAPADRPSRCLRG